MNGLPCPACGWSDTRVIDRRNAPGGVRRRRECCDCRHRFTTDEHMREGDPQTGNRLRQLEALVAHIARVTRDQEEEG